MSATTAMLDGIKEACAAWGRAMRWMLTIQGEGYPTMATFERALQGELDAKAQVGIRQRFGEVLLKDALAVSVAIRTSPMMPEELHRLIFMQYVVPERDAERRKITVTMKANELGYTNKDGEGDRRRYSEALTNAHHWLLAKIPIDSKFHEEQDVRTVCA